MNLKKIVFLSFIGFLMAAPFLYADHGPRSTDVTIKSSEKNLFGRADKKENAGLVFYEDDSTYVGTNGDSVGVRNSF